MMPPQDQTQIPPSSLSLYLALSLFLTYSQVSAQPLHSENLESKVISSINKNKTEKKAVSPLIKDMVLIDGGDYKIGLAPEKGLSECQKYFDRCKLFTFIEEGPEHTVSVDNFYIDKYEVTQKHFKEVTGNNPSEFIGENFPVEKVHWKQASDFCEQIGKRLPTEAEWEIAAKGGQNYLYPWGDVMLSGKANLCDKNCFVVTHTGQFEDNAKYTAPVGSYPPNGYGLYDMAGNVWEWVNAWYGEGSYQGAPLKNPHGPHFGFAKIIRGGSWINAPDFLRSSFRNWSDPASQTNYFGFRCALTASKVSP
jgi:formylglycine-generating enzyme